MNLSTGFTQQTRQSYPMDLKSKVNETEIDNHIHLNSDLHSSGENQHDSEYVESMMICNEVDIEDELNKAQNEPESVFKMLSISFYDKSMSSRPAKENNYSRLRLAESNKTFSGPTQFQAIKSIGKGNGRPRLVTRNVSWNNDKAANEELAKAYAKPKVKLFSIKERPSKDLSSPLLTSKKSDMRLSLGNSLSGRMSPQIPFRDSSKEDKVLALFQNSGQLRKASLTHCLSPTNKLNVPDTKINTLVRLYSPKPTVKRSNSKQRVNENHNSQQLSPRVRTGKITGSPSKLGSGTFERNRLEYKLDVQRISFNDVRYSPALMDSLNKGSGTPQHKTCESPRRYSNLVKSNFTKGYAYSKPQKKTAAVRLETETSVHKSPKLWLKPELRIKTEDNEKPKSNLRSLLSHPQTTKNQHKNSKEKLLNWSSFHHRDSSPGCHVNETENIKSNLKLRPKIPL